MARFNKVCETTDYAEFIQHWPKLEPGLKLGLSGDLGAGKTFLIREFCKKTTPSLGFQVQSPTYAYYYLYQSSQNLYHFDFYRIVTSDELHLIGFWDIWEGETPIFIEWVEKIPEVAEACGWLVEISVTPKGRRYCLNRQVAF